MSEYSERKRSPNWHPSEKLLLVNLVADHFSVVENKKTDGVTMRQKYAEWKTISEKFNSKWRDGPRTAENLKAQWESLKKAARKEAASSRQSLIQTRGGPEKPPIKDQLYEKILSMISTTSTDPVNIEPVNMYECNSVFRNKDVPMEELKIESIDNETNDTPEMMYIPFQSATPGSQTPTSDKQDENEGITNDWREPEKSQTPKPILQEKKWTSERRPKLRYLSPLEEKKIQAIELQMEIAKEEREDARALSAVKLSIEKEKLKQERIKTRRMLSRWRR